MHSKIKSTLSLIADLALASKGTFELASCLQENEVQVGSSVAVILCGHKDKTEKISSQMQAAGVDKEKILTNY